MLESTLQAAQSTLDYVIFFLGTAFIDVVTCGVWF